MLYPESDSSRIFDVEVCFEFGLIALYKLVGLI